MSLLQDSRLVESSLGPAITVNFQLIFSFFRLVDNELNLVVTIPKSSNV